MQKLPLVFAIETEEQRGRCEFESEGLDVVTGGVRAEVSQNLRCEYDGQYSVQRACKTTADTRSWSSLHLRPYANACLNTLLQCGDEK